MRWGGAVGGGRGFDDDVSAYGGGFRVFLEGSGSWRVECDFPGGAAFLSSGVVSKVSDAGRSPEISMGVCPGIWNRVGLQILN